MRSCRFVFEELYERDGQLAKRSTNRAVFVNLHLLVNPQQRVASRSPLTCKLTELDYTSVGG